MATVLSAVALLCLVCLVNGQDREARAHILAMKTFDPPSYVAQNKNITVNIQLFNIGQQAAYEISVDDEQGHGMQVQGKRTFDVDKLAAGSNITLTYSGTCDQPTTLPSTAAKVVYKLEPKSDETKTVWSNQNKVLKVLTASEYERINAKHYKEWITFLVLSAAIPIGLPWAVYRHANAELVEMQRSAKRA
eukprot:TRINITY_DN79243_c0_g1_i1.p1 TRINITY_DN79243_c0_g1~~TRINITY_DN79243_c0_g1_i1.p1  ORF type:complete len:191 (-),score=22.84 TRINITY_DN79243_c0_g1_i1:86-658(-)